MDIAKILYQRLEDVGANIIGAVLNKFEAESNGYSYYNYYYEHESGRKTRKKKKGRNCYISLLEES